MEHALHDERLGALQRVVLLRLGAREAALAGDGPLWRRWLGHCLDLADGAGLWHQWRSLQREYPGVDLARLLDEHDRAAMERQPTGA